ncbi:hypothetical protein XBKQ1_620009 [Xenorhabdus bovienii str. kraussei Quebec]|uniref:Uncharacterized protein n=1 Tax=Xenorhabdus bovienii str. kraussei Quebec TaxID=1398203 RepID=A0A077PLX3_XENBV|nr:hypothetical protein XBKQ1_620009 [Xenorhabdus bovienii str. kraussei Quebec]
MNAESRTSRYTTHKIILTSYTLHSHCYDFCLKYPVDNFSASN